MTVYMTRGRRPRPRQVKSHPLRISSKCVSSIPSRSILTATVCVCKGCIHSSAEGYVNSSTRMKSPGSRSILKHLYNASVFPHDIKIS